MPWRSSLFWFGVFAITTVVSSVPYGQLYEELHTYEVQQARATIYSEIEPIANAGSQPLASSVTGDLLRVDQVVSNAERQDALLAALTYANSLMLTSDEIVDRDYVLKSLDRVYDQMSDLDLEIEDGAVINGATLTDATVANALTLNGFLELQSVTPASITNRLYNTGGDLYWNGALLNGSTTASWSAVAGDVFRATGNVGIGTTTPSTELFISNTGSPTITLNEESGSMSDSGVLSFQRTAEATRQQIGSVEFINAAQIEAWTDIGDATAGDLRFYTDAPGLGFGLQEHMRIDSAGNVGIGTTTPTSMLTVEGSGLFTGPLTAAILDTGGQVCNVEAYGAVGDNSTINDAAIARAIAECPEGEAIYFPMGEFRISTPIVLDRPVTFRGAYSPRWSYSSTPRSSIRADFGSFSGVAMIHVRDRSISGETDDNNGGRIEYMSLDGGSASTNVDGIYFEGLVRDWKLTDVDISQVTGNGFEAAVGTGSGNPRGFTIRGLSIYSADGHGFRATALNDSYIDDLLSVGNALRGIYLSSMGETKVANSRAVFNGLTGLYIDGASANGGISFTDFSTDRNDRHGVRISSTGTSTIIFNGLLTRRDGPNTSGGTETPYAGVAIIGSSTEKVAPVFISGLGQTVGIDDQGNPPLAPLTGVRVTNAEYVKIDGQLWGVNEAWRDDGGNDFFIIEDDAILKTGTAGAQELFTNERKWQSTSTDELIFDNRVHIGSSTDSRLFNIVAPNEVGFRLRDTTNDVTMDARVEDFQAFIGTFTNHQMRFQTNNTSRLTIDIDGDVGIGTTSPSAQLTVADDVRFVSITGGTLETDALGNVTVSSDERLKDVVSMYNAGLEEVLELEPITYRWTEESGYDTASVYAGFSAQNVEEVLPEAVGENQSGFKTLTTRPILAAVVSAVQELWANLTGLQAQVDAQAERIEALEALLEVEQEDEPPAQLPAETESDQTDAESEDEIEDDQTASTTPTTTDQTEDTASEPEDIVDETTEADEVDEPTEKEVVEESSVVESAPTEESVVEEPETEETDE